MTDSTYGNLPVPAPGPDWFQPAAGQPLQIGDFIASPETVQMSGRVLPIGGTTWRYDDSTAFATRIPTGMIVAAIVLIPCTACLSLLFLLAKERYVSGFVTVEVSSRGMALSSRIYVNDFRSVDWTRRAVEQAQGWSLAAWHA